MKKNTNWIRDRVNHIFRINGLIPCQIASTQFLVALAKQLGFTYPGNSGINAKIGL